MNITIQGKVILAKDTGDFDTERVIGQIKAVAFNNDLRVVNGSDRWVTYRSTDGKHIETCTMKLMQS